MQKTFFRAPRLLVAAAALTLCGVLSSLSADGAFAAYVVCRTDPTVYLSDGHTIVMYADIGTDISNVQHVYYTLHVPVGVTATGISYDSSGSLESVSVVADQWGGHGYSDTYVVTSGFGVPVTAYSSIQGVAEGTIIGFSGQHLRLYI